MVQLVESVLTLYKIYEKVSDDFKPLCLHAGLGETQLYFMHTVIKELLLMVLIR